MDFMTLLKDKQLKATPQRLSVLNVLNKNEHPTIEMLYREIKIKNPSISLATIYKNLGALKDSGIIVEINMPNGKTRYDICTKPHIHVICTQCGHVEDEEYSLKLFDYQSALEKENSWNINRVDVVVTINGCRSC